MAVEYTEEEGRVLVEVWPKGDAHQLRDWLNEHEIETSPFEIWGGKPNPITLMSNFRLVFYVKELQDAVLIKVAHS